jgi:hypothetical protein
MGGIIPPCFIHLPFTIPAYNHIYQGWIFTTPFYPPLQDNYHQLKQQLKALSYKSRPHLRHVLKGSRNANTDAFFSFAIS